MKILILTLDTTGEKIQIIIDKIVYYYKDHTNTLIRTVSGACYVKESPEFITQQLTSAAINSYTVYNSEEQG